MIHKRIWISLGFSAAILSGCAALSQNGGARDREARLHEVESLLDQGELYRAKKRSEEVLVADPESERAQKLMAQILDEEIARHKEAFEPRVIEEYSSQEKSRETRTWLERGRLLLEVKQYNEALLAAEKVFSYEAGNLEASRLIDEIRGRAHREGKGEDLILAQMKQEEVKGRLEIYQEQAREWVRLGRWGAARLAVEKILLLSPGDPEALRLQRVIAERQSEARP